MSGSSSQRTAKQRPDLRDFRIPVHGHTHPRNGGALVDGVGGGSGAGGGGGGGTIFEVKDGSTTVSPAAVLDFTTGAVVSDLGGGVAGVAITDTRGLPLGLTGATAATRYVGATASGAPVSGTFAVGDFIIDQSGSAWVCTVAGSPGTWVQLGGGGNATGQFIFGFDAGAFTIVPGKQQDLIAPFAGTITGWTILTDQTGSCVIDLWKNVYGSFPPTVTDTIIDTGSGGVKPTVSGSNKAQSASVAFWTTAVAAGDIIRANLDSTVSYSRILLVIDYSRP